MQAEEQEQKRAKGTSWKSVYDDLRMRIVTLDLAPGSLLDESSLAEHYVLSRSPIREALIRLAGDELVVTLNNRSTIVAPLNFDMFPKYIEALDIAQRMNSRLAAELRTDEDIAILKARQKDIIKALKQNDHLALSEANKAFHMAIAEAGRNPYFINFYGRLLDLGRRILLIHFRYLERIGNDVFLAGDHEEMIEAIRAKDANRADELAQAHTREFRENFIDFLKERFLDGQAVKL